MPKEIIEVISKRPIRNTVITEEEILNLRIDLEVSKSVNSFLYTLERKGGGLNNGENKYKHLY